MTLVRCLALLLWLASWVAPTALSGGGGYLQGYEVVLGAAGALLGFPAVLFALPLIWLSLATNLLFLAEAIALARRRAQAGSVFRAVLTFAALLLNLGVVWHIHENSRTDAVYLPGLLALPGVYLWLLAYAFLSLAAALGQRVFVSGLIARMALTGVVAAVVIALAFGLMLFLSRQASW
jgi:hypothetical protein